MDSDADDYQSMENLQASIIQPELSTPTKKKKKKKKKQKKNQEPAESSFQATIQVFQEQSEKLAPLVGYFPSGYDPNERKASSTMAKVFRNKTKPKRLQLVVSPSTSSKVDFVGTNYSGEAAAGQQNCNYALGVLDKETQTLKIVPIASNKIFRLEPKVRGLDSSSKESESLAKGELTAEQKSERITKLTNLYGTKKSRREAEKLKALNQELDPEAQRDLDGILKHIVVKKDDIESSQIHQDRNIPPYNVAATSPEEAYPLDRIIFKGEWDFLENIYQLLQEESEEVTWDDAYPTFICKRIHKLQAIKDEEEKKRMSCIFSYITHLIKFKDLHSMDGVSSAKRHKIPSILRQKFSTMFADADSKKLSSEKNDLLISYVLVLTLYADAFRTDFSDIAKDLKMASLTLRVHYEHLGCKLGREKGMWFASLPLPLKFPQVRQKRRR